MNEYQIIKYVRDTTKAQKFEIVILTEEEFKQIIEYYEHTCYDRGLINHNTNEPNEPLMLKLKELL